MQTLPSIPSFLAVLLVCAATTAGTACADPAGEDAASATGASTAAEKASSKAVWPEDRQKLVAVNHGGGLAMRPEDATCTIGTGTYTLDLETRVLSWNMCRADARDSVWRMVRASRVLSAKELATVDAAMHDVRLATGDMCPEDLPMRTIEVTSASQLVQPFVEESAFCGRPENGKPIANIDGVFRALEELAK